MEEGASLQPERRRWEVSDCPGLKGTVKRRTLLQKLVGRAGGWLSAGGVCVCVCAVRASNEQEEEEGD